MRRSPGRNSSPATASRYAPHPLHRRSTAPRSEVVTAAGRRFPYDALVIATGSVVRQIPLLPLGAPRVHYLRTEAHADALAAELEAAQHLVVVGGGLIGLEVAASAAELGVKVTVIEMRRASSRGSATRRPRRVIHARTAGTASTSGSNAA